MAQESNGNQFLQTTIEAFKHIPLTDAYDNELKTISVRLLEKERAEIYTKSNKFQQLQHKSNKQNVALISVECEPKNEADDIRIDDIRIDDKFEKIFMVNNVTKEIEELEMEDMIMYDEISPSSAVEYTFYENGPWFLSGIGLNSLDGYKNGKFKVWEEQIEKPVCEAAFKRLLCIGLITNIYDKYCFEIPENEKENYIVKDDHGNDVELPRPVKRLRIWDVKTRKYEEINPRLTGAPTQEEEEKYWQDKLNKFRETRGVDYINGLLASFERA